MMFEGVSDITSTEGNLKNFTRICLLIGDKAVERRTLLSKIKNDKLIHRKNEKVIGRHLSIMTKLNIIGSELEMYRLLPNGKMLFQYAQESDISGQELSDHEIIFYFTTLFTGKTLPQLALLLHTLKNNDSATKEELVYQYYNNYLKTHLQIWNRESLERRLHEYETSKKIQRAEENRFDCMIKWLESIRLVSSNKLTQSGSDFIKAEPIFNFQTDMWFEYQQRVSNEIFYLAATSLLKKNFEPFDINLEVNRRYFLNYVKEALNLFGNKSSRTISSVYFTNWVPSELLLHNGVFCSKKNLETLIDQFYDKRLFCQ
jgi:hypothetical protein